MPNNNFIRDENVKNYCRTRHDGTHLCDGVRRFYFHRNHAGVAMTANRYSDLTPAQITALERRYDGPITDKNIADFLRLWEWENSADSDALHEKKNHGS